MAEIACVVCYRDVYYFSVGSCDHSVCYECSARMRVLLQQNECPICRKNLDIVVFTRGSRPFKELEDKLTKFIYRPQHGIYLESDEIEQQLEKLLEHRCNFCAEHPYFNTFDLLKTHVQRNHDLFCCDLCTENIKHFPKERRFYTRSDLAYHKRKGDKNDKSHRGHPLCQFCDRRYFDSDELFKHLRKDHYYCHFCDADGMNFYYNDYDALRIHFRSEHFLCEEENCKDEKFTSVFRTEIDLKAHLTTAHSRMLGKHGMKQARVVDVQFAMAPRADDERRTRRFAPGGRFGGRNRDGHGVDKDLEEAQMLSQMEAIAAAQRPPKVEINTDSAKDFPSLEGAAPPILSNGTSGTASIAQRLALSSGMNVGATAKSKPSRGVPVNPSKWNAKVTGSSRMEEEFPALGGPADVDKSAEGSRPATATTVLSYYSQPRLGPTPAAITSNSRASQMPAKKVYNKVGNGHLVNNGPVEDFPSLGNPIDRGAGSGSAWTGSGVKMKPKSKIEKVAPAPIIETNMKPVTNDSDFQYVPLSVSNSKSRKEASSKMAEMRNEEEMQGPILVDQSPEKLKKKKKNRAEGGGESSVAKAAAALFNGGTHHSGSSKQAKSHKALTSDDFPSLGPTQKQQNNALRNFEDLSISKKEENAYSSCPPPGFQPNIAGFQISAPPPGFAPKITSDPMTNDLFSISSSENDRVTSGKATATCAVNNDNLYIQPPSFTERNQHLFESIRGSLNADGGSCELFRTMSNQYRRGEIASSEYYELCQDMFGTTDFRIIFPELLALLPNIQRQQELLTFHRTAGGVTNGLTSCHLCGQVVKSGDISAHMRSHNEAELFPALGR